MRLGVHLARAGGAQQRQDLAQAQQARQDLDRGGHGNAEELRILDRDLPSGVPVWLGGAHARYLAEALSIERIQGVADPEALARRVRRLPALRKGG